MSKDEALKTALEALVYASSYCDTYDAIDAIKQALAAPAAEPETDSCGSGAGCLYKVAMIENLESEVERLKAAQPAFKPLTDDQIEQLAFKHLDVGDGERGTHYVFGEIDFARAIEAAHGITKGQP
jgi:hypothetical protein